MQFFRVKLVGTPIADDCVISSVGVGGLFTAAIIVIGCSIITALPIATAIGRA